MFYRSRNVGNIKFLKIQEYQIIDPIDEDGLFQVKLTYDKNALMAKGYINFKKSFNKHIFKEGRYNFFINDIYLADILPWLKP
jgi:hypothetical protein